MCSKGSRGRLREQASGGLQGKKWTVASPFFRRARPAGFPPITRWRVTACIRALKTHRRSPRSDSSAAENARQKGMASASGRVLRAMPTRWVRPFASRSVQELASVPTGLACAPIWPSGIVFRRQPGFSEALVRNGDQTECSPENETAPNNDGCHINH
jgi:hypothetical protein